MRPKLLELKNRIKADSLYLKYCRLTRKQNPPEVFISARIEAKAHTVDPEHIRHAHIAYCLLRGRSYEQIERPRAEHRLQDFDWKVIHKLIETYRDEVMNEDVHSNS